MTGLLHTDNISRIFGGLTAVESLSIDVGEKEILGIVGPNGAGKTTAINVISGTLRPTNGHVCFEGRDITGMRPHSLVKLGLIRTFQSTTVFGKVSVIENVLRGTYSWSYPGFWSAFLETEKARAAQRDALAAANEVLQWLNMEQVADSRASDLPYGHQKCLGIAIAVAARPKLVLLDEPVAGLNAEEAELVRLAILKMRDRGIAVIVIDHNVRFMSKLCDRIVVMHHGAEIVRGTPQEVFSDRKVVEAYLGKANVTA